MQNRFGILVGCAIVLPGLIVVLVACTNGNDVGGDANSARLPVTVSGKVTGAQGVIGNAIVQVQGTANKVTTAQDGTFTLHGEGLGGRDTVTITAWAQDHYIGWTTMTATSGHNTDTPIEIEIKPLFEGDNHAYTWFNFEGKTGAASCGLCHREYPEWQADSHSQAARNPRFISMYRGTNLQGQRGQPTQFATDGKALPPDPNLPNYGPGFRLDNGDRPGNCAACHTPMAAKIETQNGCAWSGCHSPLTADRAEAVGATTQTIRGVSATGHFGIGEEGVGCEFCHVIRDVILDPATGLPSANAPGIMSYRLQRPPEGHKVFFGTLTDANREEVTYSPVQSQSQFCAGCHYGVMGGVVNISAMQMVGGVEVYSSYKEWLESPWSNPQTGKTCQDCHMPARTNVFSVPPELGGVARPQHKYHDHTMAGTTSQALMWNAVSLTGEATRNGGALNVSVRVTNDKTGHAVPTDAPIRSVMLIVEAVDASGQLLTRRTGPTLPEWTGNYAGQSGRAFAKILKDTWTGEMPTAAYWRPVELIEDTRLFPMKTDTSTYAFDLPDGAVATVRVKLVYRPAFQRLAQQKGWGDSDFVMNELILTVK
jgi:hypothetical protein